MSQQIDPRALRKRMLLFYFACGVNLLMAVWVLASGGQVAGGALTLVELVFIGFAGVNYYMARRIGKFLQRLGPPPARVNSEEVSK